MMTIEAEDWSELVEILQNVRADLHAGEKGEEANDKLESGLQSLKAFHTMAAMLGIGDLEQVGIGLEDYLKRQVDAGTGGDAGETFDLALGKLIEEVQSVVNGGNGGINRDAVLGILEAGAADGREEPLTVDKETAGELPAGDQDSGEEAVEAAREPAVGSTGLNLMRMQQVVAQLGGEMVVEDEAGEGKIVELRFRAEPSGLEKIEALLTKADPTAAFASEVIQEDKRLQRVLAIITDFMQAFSGGDVKKSQEILLTLAEQQHDAGLYNEVGIMARELHTSLKGFMDTLDPTLREMVQDRLPDSGNRLEHILELTENAANTTLDHAEAMQKRNHEDQNRLQQLQDLIVGLQAIGEGAQQQLLAGREITQELITSALQTHDNVFAVLTAQDYQDLTGQIIQKIITLLKDLELKLVNVIQVFGVKVDRGERADASDELYGPAYQGKAEALHSQDDVDALLADFGF